MHVAVLHVTSLDTECRNFKLIVQAVQDTSALAPEEQHKVRTVLYFWFVPVIPIVLGDSDGEMRGGSH